MESDSIEGVREDVKVEFLREEPYECDYQVVDRDTQGYRQLCVYGGECGRDRKKYNAQ